MVPYVRTLTAAGSSPFCVVDTYADPFAVSLALTFGGAVATAKVQYTLDDYKLTTDQVGSNLTWFDHPTLAGLTAAATGNIAFPVRAVRLTATAYTSGTVTMTLIQAGV